MICNVPNEREEEKKIYLNRYVLQLLFTLRFQKKKCETFLYFFVNDSYITLFFSTSQIFATNLAEIFSFITEIFK